MKVSRNHESKTRGKKRSGRWPSVRRAHLKKNGSCAVCGGTKFLEVHHIRPFHDHPELELDLANLITLCENVRGGLNCHLFFGHLGSYQSCNLEVVSDAVVWSQKIKGRP